MVKEIQGSKVANKHCTKSYYIKIYENFNYIRKRQNKLESQDKHAIKTYKI